MAQWLVQQRDSQFGVETLNELKRLATSGQLVSGDIVQPPGATGWLYAMEIPELKGLFRPDEEVGGGMSEGTKTMLLAVLGAGLVGLVLLGGGLMVYGYSAIPDGTESLVGDNALRFSEMIVTEQGAGLKADAADAAPVAVALEKDQVLELLAKRGEYYRARTKDGQEGWIAIGQVLPIYQLGGKEARAEFDPLYNPDRYVEVGNAAWMMAEGSDRMTVFRFMMTNSSKYPMTDLKLLATVKDGKGNELERVEFPVSGVIPAGDTAGPGDTMVGTLKAEAKGAPGQLMTEAAFQEQSKTDPDLALRWVDGVEVEMKTRDFAVATIDIVEVRAVPAAE